MQLTENQIEKCLHMLGLNRSKTSTRNYYNSGTEMDPDLQDLVDKKLAYVHDNGKELGGLYYHLNEAGKRLIEENYANPKG